MAPKAIRNQSMVRGSDGLLRFEMIDGGREFVLDPLAELIWDLCDGSHDIEALAQAAGRAFDRVVHREEVFSALDFLADAGLIEERVAPPVAEGNVSRRLLLTRIAPVVGAAAWMMSGISARAGGLIQYNESANKESDRKASDREYNNKESGNKAANRESDNKEQGNKNHDHESDDKRDWDRQQDAEKRRKSDFKKTMDEVNDSERQSDLLQQKMRASWPKVYELVGHKLSEFPELSQCWVNGVRKLKNWNGLTADNYEATFLVMQNVFANEVRQSPAALARYRKAGFELPNDYLALYLHSSPSLAGDSERKTYLILEQIADPEIGDNWRLAINPDNLFLQFHDPKAAYQFLSSRGAAGRQTKK